MEKIKPFITNSLESQVGKDILTIIIVILVGLGSFGLGRLSKNPRNEGIKIEYKGEVINQQGSAIKAIKELESTGKASAGPFFASSRGSKYYPSGCSAGKSIKQGNRVYFESKVVAESAGYSLSTSCK